MDQKPPHSFARKFVRGGMLNQFWSGSAQGVGLANSFLILTALSVYHFGLYQLALSAAAMAAAFSTDFFDNVVVNDISRSLSEGRKAEAKRLFLELAGVKILLGFIVALVFFFGAAAVAKYYGQDIASFIRILSVLVLARAVRSAAGKFLGAVVSLRAVGATAVEEFAKLLFIFSFFFFSSLGVREVLWASVLGALASALYVLFPFFREYRAAMEGVRAARRFILPAVLKLYGFWIILRHAAVNAGRSAIPWLIRLFLNTEAVALYTLAANLRALILQLLPYNLGNLLAWEADYPKRLAYIFSRSMKYAFWAGILAAAAGILAVPPAVSFVFPKYAPAMPLFAALVLALPLIGMSRVQQSALVALREQKLLTARTFTAVATDLAALAALLPAVGLWALAIENFYSYIFRLVFYQRNLSRKYPHLGLPLRGFFRFDSEDAVIFRRGWQEAKLFFKSGNFIRS